MKVLTYTFRSFPEISNLELIFGRVFVFGNLKKDLNIFLDLIKKEKPDLVLGIAISSGKSRIEPIAVNRFNKGKITQGPEELNLTIPAEITFDIAKYPTTTFCNWTMYMVADNIQNLKIKNSFIHINLGDLSELKKIL